MPQKKLTLLARSTSLIRKIKTPYFLIQFLVQVSVNPDSEAV